MNNLIITNARIVTPIGHSARKGKEMSKLLLIERGTIEVKDGIIVYVGDEKKHPVNEQMKEVRYYDAKGRCLLPGFVDSHTHFVFGGERAKEFSWRLGGESYMSIMNRGGGIVNTVKATRAMDFDTMYDRANKLLRKMSRMGITTVEGKSGYGLDCDTELRQLEVMKKLNEKLDKRVDISATFLGAHAIPEEYKGKADEYIDFLIKEMLPIIKRKKLAKCCDVFCEEGVFSVEQSRRLLVAAKDVGFALKIHADEIVSFGGAELAAELGAVSADHLLHASDAGIKAMADKNVIATLLPLTAFALKEQYACGREMIDAGCAVALATDLNPGSCFSGSIPLTIDLACIYMKLSIEEVIIALTLNGAAAINSADKIGSVEVGKQADFVILDSSDYHYLPYYIGMNCVGTVVKNGRIYEIEN